MKDFLGNEVKVGDKVACLEKGYNNLAMATVVKITPQNMKVKYEGRLAYNTTINLEVLRSPKQAVKV